MQVGLKELTKHLSNKYNYQIKPNYIDNQMFGLSISEFKTICINYY